MSPEVWRHALRLALVRVNAGATVGDVVDGIGEVVSLAKRVPLDAGSFDEARAAQERCSLVLGQIDAAVA